MQSAMLHAVYRAMLCTVYRAMLHAVSCAMLHAVYSAMLHAPRHVHCDAAQAMHQRKQNPNGGADGDDGGEQLEAARDARGARHDGWCRCVRCRAHIPHWPVKTHPGYQCSSTWTVRARPCTAPNKRAGCVLMYTTGTQPHEPALRAAISRRLVDAETCGAPDGLRQLARSSPKLGWRAYGLRRSDRHQPTAGLCRRAPLPAPLHVRLCPCARMRVARSLEEL